MNFPREANFGVEIRTAEVLARQRRNQNRNTISPRSGLCAYALPQSMKWNLFHRVSPLSNLSPSRAKALILPSTGRTQEGCIATRIFTGGREGHEVRN